MSTPSLLRGDLRRRIVAHVEEFHWWHTTLGMIGNTSFFVGSVLFLWESTKLVAIWLFIVGSLGMLLGSLGDAAAKLRDEEERRRGRHHREAVRAASGSGDSSGGATRVP